MLFKHGFWKIKKSGKNCLYIPYITELGKNMEQTSYMIDIFLLLSTCGHQQQID